MPTDKFFNADGHMVKVQWGRHLPEIIIGAAQSESPGSPGWFVAITDRNDANRIIRAIRRARDQAFGKDE